MGKRCQMDAGKRRELVLALLRKEEPAAVLARRHEISEQTLLRWRDDFIAAGEAALGHGRSSEQRSLIEENKQLKCQLAEREQVIGEITVANRILKKIQDGLI